LCSGELKMKRLIIFLITISLVSTFALAQRRNRRTQKIIQLPQPRLTGSMSLEQALVTRRSVREFLNRNLNYSQLGQLAWAGQGITEENAGLRTAPSAGAIYPVTLYFATEQGLFVYKPQGHTLDQVENKDIRADLSKAALNQSAVADAACDIIIAGSVKQVGAKYGRNGRTFAVLEAGHIAQNIHLQAVALGLGSVPVGAFEDGTVRKTCRMPRELEPFYIIPVGYPAVSGPEIPKPQQKEDLTMSSDQTRKAMLIIASSKFRDEELFKTEKVLKQAQIETVIAGSKLGSITGMLGGTAEAKFLLTQINVDDYDAVIFIGGIGAREYYENAAALDIAKQTVEKGKILAAICIAPAILANAGLLDGKNVTSYPSEKIRLIKAGASYTGTDVERDGQIITASGPRAAEKFAKAIVNALQSR